MSVDILIWDSVDPAPIHQGITIFWRQFASNASSGLISIPTYIEENADEIKKRYLAWIYDLGETRIEDTSVTGFLKIREDFSYWWMTPFAEKNNYAQSPQITDAIRLIAFDIWAKNLEITSASVFSNNDLLVECLTSYFEKLGNVSVNQFRIEEKLSRAKKHGLPRFIPESIKTLVWLSRYYIQRRSMHGVGIPGWNKSIAGTTFFSYLLNLEVSPNKSQEFASSYWGLLPPHLDLMGVKTNWLHIYIKSPIAPNPRAAADLVRKLNDSNKNGQSHVLLDSFLSLRVVFNSILNWVELKKRLRVVDKVLSGVTCGNLDFWPLFRKEYDKSSNGIRLMENLITLNLFQEACRKLPKQQKGIYLFEQQPWEAALIKMWRNNLHGEIIGAQHSTVLFWDLRYFNDSRVYSSESKFRLPIADKVAVNGPAAMKILVDSGFPSTKLVQAEALRYLNLGEQLKVLRKDFSNLVEEFRILVMGDYLLKNSQIQMKLLEGAIPKLPFKTKITLKPHPACPLYAEDFPTLLLEVTNEKLTDLFLDCDVAFSSMATSAAVESYVAGIPVVSVLNADELNMSPLRGYKNVQFASNIEELVKAFESIKSGASQGVRSEGLFNYDSKLTSWSTLLAYGK
jgi:surface carbohydrate biosynthesis protein (TIGR04326 family)